ncbi:glomulin isoform X2 [Aethina tumida]|uniref:glomulin isoform X2 n=1 Tax=Aethina tumida TaxID=116153 RepID=UPI00214812EE|nr:glomulin isoform X2 [Aethina tumida]
MTSTDDYSDFVKSVQRNLEEGNTVHALTIFTDNKNSVEVQRNSWDLIPLICKYLTNKYETEHIEVFKCCEKLLSIVSEQSNPEESLLQFIEEIEESNDDTKFIALLKPLPKVFSRIPLKRLNSLAWCLNAIEVYLKKIEPPKAVNLVGKEKLLMDTDENSVRITTLYLDMLPFYDMFLREVKVNKNEQRVGVIQKFMIQLLGDPLVYLDMEVFDGIKSRARTIAEHIIEKLFQTVLDPVKFLKMTPNEKDGDMYVPSLLGVAVMFYLVYSEFLQVGNYPKVYASDYFFQNSLYLVTELLKKNNQITVEKGLDLAAALLKHVEGMNLSYLMLDSPDHSEFCKTLSNVIVYNELELIRKKAIEVYKKYLWCFDKHGVYLLVYNIVTNETHSGLIGFTITQYKEVLFQQFANETEISEYYRGENLFKLLKLVCCLKKGPETDLLEVYEQILSSLNFLRFLALQDKENRTNIWNYFPHLEESYLSPLRKGIELSRAHYELKVKEVKEEKPEMSGSKETEMVVTVSGQDLPHMETSEKLQLLHCSLNRFDVMDSVLSRVIELTDKK